MTVRFTADPRKATRIIDPRPIVTGENFTRSTAFDGAALDEKTFTVSAIIATAHPRVLRDAKGPFLEILDSHGLDFAPEDDFALVTDHEAKARTTIGRAYDIGIEDDRVTAKLRFTSADDAAPIRQRVKDGTLRHLSVGYHVLAWREGRDAEGRRTKTAIRWRLIEVTLTPTPADRNATITRNRTMEEETIELTPAQHRAEIRNIGRAGGMTAEAIDDMIDRGIDATAARAEAFEAMQARQRSTPRIRVTANHDDPAAIVTRAADAVAHRMGAAGELPAASREYANMSLLDLARDSLSRAGVSVRGLSADETLQRSQHTASDFPQIVSNAMGKVALDAYRAAESAIKPLARRRTLTSFRPSTAIRFGELGSLEPMTESGEFTHTTAAEAGESMALTTYGRAINVSRNLIINDDLGLLGDLTAAFGQAAAQREASELVKLFTTNPVLSDGNPVFGAGRGNYATTGSALADGTLNTARVAMRKVKGLDGVTIIDAAPKYLLVSPDLEQAAEKLLAAIYATTTDDVNTHAGKLTLLVEPRFTGNGWWLLSDRVPTIQLGYLAGAEGVQIQRNEAWTHLGLSYRAWLDFGCGWLDWRGAYAATGAS